MEAARSITISCHCGAARQTLVPRGDSNLFSGISFCHCDTCRHSTGLLCSSYAPVSSNPLPSLAGLQSYATSPTSTRYFCSTCGCHVLRATHPSPSASPEEWEWEVATGVILDAPESSLPEKWHHRNVDDTKDGGLSPFLLPSPGPLPGPPLSGADTDILHASCHCKSISLQITRPSPDSADNPDSPYPDLLLPYISTPPETVANPSREKWYLRPVPSSASSKEPGTTTQEAVEQAHHKTKYLAGTCACQPCRLTSGFEIQTWAFIPRGNISISIPTSSSTSISTASPDQLDNHHHQTKQQQQEQEHHDPQSQQKQEQKKYQPLSFPLPPTHPLKPYTSTPGRTREFCSTCGATIFWHDSFRPDLIDVSAGLFHSPNGADGARVESWLEWWTGRVSFSEDAGKGRTGGAKKFGEGVIKTLEEGMGRVHVQRQHLLEGQQ